MLTEQKDWGVKSPVFFSCLWYILVLKWSSELCFFFSAKTVKVEVARVALFFFYKASVFHILAIVLVETNEICAVFFYTSSGNSMLIVGFFEDLYFSTDKQ